MSLPQLSIVRLINDRHHDQGVGRGSIGVIVEVYDNAAYEVEFSNPATGETVALFALSQSEVEPLSESEDRRLPPTGD